VSGERKLAHTRTRGEKNEKEKRKKEKEGKRNNIKKKIKICSIPL
jgi:hypothetical protein